MRRAASGQTLGIVLLVTLLLPFAALAVDPAATPGTPEATLGTAEATPGTPPTVITDLSALLVTGADLPAGMTSGGIGDGSTFDTDPQADAANGGLATVEQTWQAPTQGPVAIVFDFRFQFPTEEQAQAYLTAAEPIRSEAAASGLALVSDSSAIGEGYRHYAGQASANGQTAELQNILFRVGPIVAKVFVGGFGTTPADVLPIAQAAADRIVAALGAPASPTPAASPVTSGQPRGEIRQ